MKIEITTSPVLSCLHPAGQLTGIYFKYVEETGVFIEGKELIEQNMSKLSACHSRV